MTFKENKLLLFINIISLLIFILLAVLIGIQKIEYFDNKIYEFISTFQTSLLTNIAIIISEIGDVIGIVLICLVILINSKTRWLIGIPASITVAISALLNSLLKLIFRRQRPNILRLVEETSFSFPSGHSMNNMSLYFMVILCLLFYTNNKSKKYSASIIILLFVICVGLSRIYLGVHYASDVLGGFSLGIWVSTTCFFILNSTKLKNKMKIN